MIRKKSLTVFIVLFFCVCSILIGCKNTPQENKLLYEINSDSITCTITGIGTYNDVSVIIPDSIDGYTVTAISKNAFSYNESIEEVFISDTVIEIGAYAFSECTNLRYVNLPANLTIIENNLFEECVNLQSINIPMHVKIIESYAFQGCESIVEISLPESLESIKSMAFAGCHALMEVLFPEGIKEIGENSFTMCDSLTEVFIPASVELIDTSPFLYCMSLLKIDVDQNNPKYSSIDGVLYDKNQTRLIGYPAGKTDEKFIVPNSVVTIYIFSFTGNEYLEELYFPTSVIKLYPGIIAWCNNLTSLYFDGTTSQWENIYKYPEWNKFMDECTIYCTDGQIDNDGTVTYY